MTTQWDGNRSGSADDVVDDFDDHDFGNNELDPDDYADVDSELFEVESDDFEFADDADDEVLDEAAVDFEQ